MQLSGSVPDNCVFVLVGRDYMKHSRIFVISGIFLIIAAAMYAILSINENDIIIVYKNKTGTGMENTISSTYEISTEKITEQIETTCPEVTETLYVNINTAEKDELIKLNKIGEVLAERIMAYREEHNGFNNIEEIMLVSGIGEGIFNEVSPYIYVEKPVYPVTTTKPEQTAPETQTTQAIQTTKNILTTQTTQTTQTTCTSTEATTEVTVTETAPATEETQTEPIIYDLNTVTYEELMCIPSMEEEYAALIVSFREELGRYRHIYELIYIEEIPENLLREYFNYLEIVE